MALTDEQQIHVQQAEAHIEQAEVEHSDDNDDYQASLMFAQVHALLSKVDVRTEHYHGATHYLSRAEDMRDDGREFVPSLMFAQVHALLAQGTDGDPRYVITEVGGDGDRLRDHG